jgi:hypothetical protein
MWPVGEDIDAKLLSAQLTYNSLTALYLGYLILEGGFTSALLWPTCALHGFDSNVAGWFGLREIFNNKIRPSQSALAWHFEFVINGDQVMSQNHFTLSFPLKSPSDAKAVSEELLPLMAELFKVEDAIGTIHYSRFTMLSDKTLLFLGDFDGEFGILMAEFAKLAGPVFEAIFQHLNSPPPIPVADNADAFVEWVSAHLLHAVNIYSAYPDFTVQEVKALASAADVAGTTELNPFLVILPSKSKLAYLEVQLILRARGSGTAKDLDKVGTPHFAQFVPLEDNQIGFFTVYDGSFDQYIADFTKNIGPVFDLLFKFTKGAPPSPCRKHLQEFIDFANLANRTPIGFYQAYPGLSVQDIHALIADSSSQSA